MLYSSAINIQLNFIRMEKRFMTGIRVKPKTAFVLLAAGVLTTACQKANEKNNLKDFSQVNLVANKSIYNPVTVDPTLQNGFGIAWSPNGIAWVNSVGGHVSELYTADGAIANAPVNIPSPDGTPGGFPCGIAFAGGLGFKLANGPAAFLFSGFDGVISGWNPASGANAQKLKNPPHASYTGLTIGGNTSGPRLVYAANFGASKIDVWDTAFSLVHLPFVDPTLPTGYSPYNIQSFGDLVFVVYGKLGTDGHGVAGQGNGFVSLFNVDGTFIKRFASGGPLNLPWGITVAQGSFLSDKDLDDAFVETGQKVGATGKAIKDPVILVGNFGDGRINVYTIDGRFMGQLKSHNKTIAIDGLWALSFAPASATSIDPNRLYFSAGPAHETDGVFGYLLKQ
jgi:uncharacterized protein (TIGR03118 family)